MSYKEIASIIKRTEQYLEKNDIEKIKDAYIFAKKAHKGQKRFSGEDYITHPVNATKILLSLKVKIDSATIIACLLHDTIEDTPVELDEIKQKFGNDVAFLVDAVSKVESIKLKGETRQIETIRKMFIAMARDIRVIFIKLSDRIHNLKTLGFVRPDKQKRIARESLEIYATVAHRLGIYSLKIKIEDLCFKYLHPIEYKIIKKDLRQKIKKTKENLFLATNKVKKILHEKGIKVQVVMSRIKNTYSIWKKLKKKNVSSLNEIYDLIAMRIIVQEKTDCYKIFGIIHDNFVPIPNKIKDYISTPKKNGYQSLHTTVLGLIKNNPIEIQIRTKDMHSEAEFGPAAHWQYSNQDTHNEAKKYKWLQNIEKLSSDLKKSNEYLTSIKLDIFSDDIFVFTPIGDIKTLKKGSVPIDFAYSIHTEIGHTCVGAKENNKIIPINKKLKSGSMVEIIINKNSNPKREWLSFVKQSETKSKIKSYINSLNKEKMISNGKDALNKILNNTIGKKLDPKLILLKKYDSSLSFQERETILQKIGNNTITASLVARKIFISHGIIKKTKRKIKKINKEKEKYDIFINGENGFDTKFAKCCNAEYGDEIIGYVTREGVSIHKKCCKMIKKLKKIRIYSASFRKNEKSTNYLINLTIKFYDRVGIVRDVSNVFVGIDASILNIKQEIKNDKVKIQFSLEIKNENCIASIAEEIEKLDSFIEINFNKT